MNIKKLTKGFTPLLLIWVVLLFSWGCGKSVSTDYLDPSLPIEQRVENLLSQMTLQEKVGQMTQVDRQYLLEDEDIGAYNLGSLLSGGGSTPADNRAPNWADMTDGYQQHALSTRLAIPLIYGIDAVHGHNNVKGATIFPHNIGLGAAGDEDLVRRIAAATAREVRATGIHWTFAPAVSVPRDERWGRHYEGFSEEPQLVSRMGAAAVRGYQGDDLADDETILACVKHFVADGGTHGGVDQGDAQITEEELRDIHLFPYYAALEAGAGSLMASFSSWNGVQMHGNSYLLNDLLREEMGFQGLVVSDWAAVTLLPGTYEEQVALAVNSGIDMVMVPDDYVTFIQSLIKLVRTGKVSRERIDEAVRRILTVKMELGLFEQPFANRDLLDTVGSDEHRALAREAVAASQVILKNDNNILPLSDEIEHLVVLGPLMNDIGAQCGGWTITWQGDHGEITQGTSIWNALRERSQGNFQIYPSLEAAGEVEIDAVIVVIGESPYAEMQGDNNHLTLNEEQMELMYELEKLDLPLITLLISGRPMMVTDEIRMSQAFVASWLPGTEGAGVVDVLFGDVNPRGKLPYSWPLHIDQLPINAGDEEYNPLFPLGHGLSY